MSVEESRAFGVCDARVQLDDRQGVRRTVNWRASSAFATGRRGGGYHGRAVHFFARPVRARGDQHDPCSRSSTSRALDRGRCAGPRRRGCRHSRPIEQVRLADRDHLPEHGHGAAARAHPEGGSGQHHGSPHEVEVSPACAVEVARLRSGAEVCEQFVEANGAVRAYDCCS